MKKFIEKLQNLPEIEKKMIFFAVMGLSVIIVGYFAIQSFRGTILAISQSVQSVHVPVADISKSIAEKFPNVPPPAPAATQPVAPDPTASWQTYVNTQAGFQIKYPETFSPKDYATLVGVDFNETIGLYVPETNLSVVDWIAKKQGIENTQAPRQLQINQYTVWQFQVAGITHTIFSGQGKIVDIYYGTTNAQDQTDTYNKMLSTFAFINQ